ncbi:hypothetical protein CYMTET_23490 [Cymbomonas tetramitiformis]|uniref:Uncharacterized protein n=1 Tax=Cymbomonas tetramitiformis TaxID=36881 RepID=A0AAE0FYB0_9CHLO|nr:hypothetical protein CYMTET_23490 [Cymbomonas tetramitiformis]
MFGETYDHKHDSDNEGNAYHKYLSAARSLFWTALVIILVFYTNLFYKFHQDTSPANVGEGKLLISGATTAKFGPESEPGDRRFKSIFESFREYERAHLVLWIVKDLMWAYSWKWPWIFVAAAAQLWAFDIVYLSQGWVSDFLFAFAIALWLFANILWAFGEMFFASHTHVASLGSEPGLLNMRWWASWIMVCALIPCAVAFTHNFNLWTRRT